MLTSLEHIQCLYVACTAHDTIVVTWYTHWGRACIRFEEGGVRLPVTASRIRLTSLVSLLTCVMMKENNTRMVSGPMHSDIHTQLAGYYHALCTCKKAIRPHVTKLGVHYTQMHYAWHTFTCMHILTRNFTECTMYERVWGEWSHTTSSITCPLYMHERCTITCDQTASKCTTQNIHFIDKKFH